MPIKRIIGRAVTKRVAKGAARSGAQKAALRKAVAASARKRSRGAVATTVSRRATKQAARTTAIKNTEKLGLRRATRGFKLNGERRISAANFRGKEGRALRRATYKQRLESSRAKYRNSSTLNKVGQALIPSYTGGPLRRRYSDLTLGENMRRNIGRSLKASPLFVGVVAAYGGLITVSARNTEASAKQAMNRANRGPQR